MQNLVLTGLRGVGKTVLLETFKPLAQSMGWLWCGTDLSESASVTEETFALRILTDLSLVTSTLIFREVKQMELGFARAERVIHEPLSFEILLDHYQRAPGLVADKLKATLEWVWSIMPQAAVSGIVFAYDEAHLMADHAKVWQYPLSVLLDVFQTVQRKGVPFLLILTGLSFSITFSMARIEIVEGSERQVKAKMRIDGECSYDPNSSLVSDIEISGWSKSLDSERGGFWGTHSHDPKSMKQYSEGNFRVL
jgi:hypothetical protein